MMLTNSNPGKFKGLALGAAFLVCGVLNARAQTAGDERFLLCASEVARKPVTRDVLSLKRSQLADLNASCPRSGNELSAMLAQRNLVLVDGGYAAVIVSEEVQQRASWRTLRLIPRTYPWNKIPDSRIPSEVEQQEMSRAVLEQVPLPPVVLPPDSDDHSELLSFDVEIWTDVHKLSGSQGAETGVVVYGESNGVRRIVVGSLDSNGYTIDWYSPLLSGRFLRLGYVDFDNDRRKEIGLAANIGSRLELATLAVLDLEGTELTRDDETCAKDFGYTRLYGLCPLVATEFDFVDRPGGGRDIVAEFILPTEGRDGHDSLSHESTRYTLRDGRFEAISNP